jgi:hypothetical protein
VSGTSVFLFGVAYGSGVFAVAGGFGPPPGGVIVNSVDGIGWTNYPVGTPTVFSDITYGTLGFVTVGASGGIAASTTGTNWQIATSGTSGDFLGVGFGNDTYIAVGGNNFTGRDGRIWTSFDGRSWSNRLSNATRVLWDVAYGAGTFVAVGSSGYILQSGSLGATLSGTMMTAGGFEGTISGEAGQSYTILVSSNLLSWEPAVKSFVSSNASFRFLDTNAPRLQCRFYQTVSP